MNEDLDYEFAKKIALEESDQLAARKLDQMRKDEEYAKKLNKETLHSFADASKKAKDIVLNSKKLAEQFGFLVKNVIWDDVKFHAENTTDFTLHLWKQPDNLPVLRPLFYESEISIGSIPLIMGNEVDKTGQLRYEITLMDLLLNFPNYYTSWIKNDESLINEDELSAKFYSQLCLIPDASSKFNIAFYNYGHNPVLTIVATDSGTSVQMTFPNQRCAQYLNFNLNGQNSPFSNVKKMLVIEVPIMNQRVYRSPVQMMENSSEGKFPEFEKEVIQRDRRKSIKVTLQMFRTLEETMLLDVNIMQQLLETFSNASNSVVL